jgi:hypothetical protein
LPAWVDTATPRIATGRGDRRQQGYVAEPAGPPQPAVADPDVADQPGAELGDTLRLGVAQIVGAVCVLELVDEHVAEAPGERPAHVLVAGQKIPGGMEQVVEVEQRGGALVRAPVQQQALHRRDDAPAMIDVLPEPEPASTRYERLVSVSAVARAARSGSVAARIRPPPGW